MKEHPFILKPGIWLGEGKIILNMVEEQLPFYTRWNIGSQDDLGMIECVQQIEVKGLSEIMINQFIFSEMVPHSFSIQLQNQALGTIIGKGIINDQLIGWEFRMPEIGFEGFEFYEILGEDSYSMHAEYATSDEFRTTIRGKIWRSMQKKEGSDES